MSSHETSGHHRCGFDECSEQGLAGSLVDADLQCEWVYRLCNIHFVLLPDEAKLAIARRTGVKNEKAAPVI